MKVGWDEELPDTEKVKWKRLAKDLNKLKYMNVPRCVAHRSKELTLHVFADASFQAYGCCAYLVSDEESNLVYAKARVAPLKPRRTIPQLELLAATLGTQVITFLKIILRIYASQISIYGLIAKYACLG